MRELEPQSLVLIIVLGEVKLNLVVCLETGPLRKDYLGLGVRGGIHRIELWWLCEDRAGTQKLRNIYIPAICDNRSGDESLQNPPYS